MTAKCSGAFARRPVLGFLEVVGAGGTLSAGLEACLLLCRPQTTHALECVRFASMLALVSGVNRCFG